MNSFVKISLILAHFTDDEIEFCKNEKKFEQFHAKQKIRSSVSAELKTCNEKQKKKKGNISLL